MKITKQQRNCDTHTWRDEDMRKNIKNFRRISVSCFRKYVEAHKKCKIILVVTQKLYVDKNSSASVNVTCNVG